MRLIPAPRGTGIVSAPVPKKLLQMAGVSDCYTSARGCTGTLGNFGMFIISPLCSELYLLSLSLSLSCIAKATFAAIANTYSYLTPDMWPEAKLNRGPFQEYSDYLSKGMATSS